MQRTQRAARDPRQHPIAGDVVCDASGAIVVKIAAVYVDPDGGMSMTYSDTSADSVAIGQMSYTDYLRWVFQARARIVARSEYVQ